MKRKHLRTEEYGKALKPNKAGFIVNWLLCGPKEEPYHTEHFNPNQLTFEKEIREIIADDSLTEVPEEINLGVPAMSGADKKQETLHYAWEYYPAFSNWFVDKSKFYFLLTKIEMYAATGLYVDTARTVRARLWTFAAVTVWVNGKEAASVKTPVYKPIQYLDFDLELNQGENEIFVRLQNLGVRDTRNIFGLQLKNDFDDVTVKPQDYERVLPLIQAEEELAAVRVRDHKLMLPDEPVTPIMVNGECWDKGCEYPVPEGNVNIVLTKKINGSEITRKIEDCAADWPICNDTKDSEEHRKAWIETLVKNCDATMSMVMPLVHLLEGRLEERDFERIRYTLPRIDSRKDCADFEMHALLCVMMVGKDLVPESLQEEIQEVVLRFRYWMDEKGSDGMCFWSENHAITFYACQLMAGKLYPNELFMRSERTGLEQNALANRRCREWLDSVEASGFEEFLSPGYMSVTLKALFSVIDYAEPDVSARAWKTADRILEMIFMHLFDHSLIGPFGRIYGNVIKPYTQDILSALSYFVKGIPVSAPITQTLIPLYELSSYQVPEHIFALQDAELHQVYQTGNAQIHLCKKADYILTSAASERGADFCGGWSYEEAMKEDPYVTGNFSNQYVKALNERFHGTTLFQPGVYGYQQHLWSAALSSRCLIFVNHPGGTHQESSMRPGYWYGNGLMPALRQWDNLLFAVYYLNEKHPISFTHTYFPVGNFDEVVKKEQWIFAKCRKGMLGLWTNCKLLPYDDVLTDCELRAYEKAQAYVCICSDQDTEGDFASFCSRCLKKSIRFEQESLTLSDESGHSLQFVEKYNDTQVI